MEKYVHGVVNPRIEDGYRTEQNVLSYLVNFRHVAISTIFARFDDNDFARIFR